MSDLLSFLDEVDLNDVAAVESDDRIPEVVVSDDRQPVFGVCVLTVPDVSRIGLPPWYGANKEPVDLSGLAEMEWGSLKPLIMPSLPQEQLEEIEAAELARDRPRKRVLDAVASERADRGERFPQWLAEKSRCLFSSRIAAVAWQAGDDEMCSLSCAGVSDEREALQAIAHAWRSTQKQAMRDRSWVFQKFGFVDSLWVFRVLAVRALSLDVDWFRPYAFCDGESVNVVGREFVAAAVGVPEAEIPATATLMDVWRKYRNDCGSHVLADWAAGQLQLERAVYERCEDVLF